MKEWLDFISAITPASAGDNFICSAEDTGLILVSGEDAGDFLQNQLSNDIDLVDENRYQLSSYSTPKGRMLGIFRVLKVSNGYLLVTHRSMVLSLLERLYHFVLQARVNLADATDYFARIALQSDRPEVTGHDWLANSPGASFQNDSVISIQLEAVEGQQRYLVFCLSAQEAIELWDELAAHLQVAGPEAWRLSEIKAAVPTIYPQTAEEFVLQMANLNPLGGVSFKKGCYPGQEIVARMQYLGKLKRRMFLAQLRTDRLPAPGEELVAPGSENADGSGKVVDAQFDPDGLCHCLYIAQIAKAESGGLQLLSQPDTRIENIELPYSI